MRNEPWNNQLDNRNYLSPVGFKFVITKAPKADFFSNSANIPGINLGFAEQPTYLKNIPVPGDKIEFGDLNLRFLVDEDLGNYMEIQNWIRGLGFPDTLLEFDDLEKSDPMFRGGGFGQFARSGDKIYSDGTLQILSSNLVPQFQVVFKDLFPYSLTTLSFDATDTDIEYFTADATFKYTSYNLTNLQNETL